MHAHAPNAIDVAAWLEALGLGEYAAAFAANDVDDEALRLLTADDLRELGVTSIGHRRKLLTAIAALSEASSVPVRVASGPPVSSYGTVAVSDRVAERRHVTVLFVDLVGSTSLSARLDPEAMHDVLQSYKDCCARIVAMHEGHILKYVGDGVIVTFGYPRALDDDAARAVRAALAIVDAVGSLAVGGEEALAARAGIASGLVVVGDLTGGVAVERDSLVGDAPNVAARLQGEAAPGQVVIAPATATLLGSRFITQELGARELKGIPGLINPLRVFTERRSASRFEATRRGINSAIAGRAAEIEFLLRCAETGLDGHGQIVLIEGEAGIGKSRLVAELFEHSRIGARPRLIFQTSPHNRGTPFYPVFKAIEYAADISPDDGPQTRFDKLAASLRLFCEVNDEQLALVGDLLGLDVARAQLAGFAPRELRARTIRALIDIMVSACEGGLLVVIEDYQWADPSTLEFLDAFMARVAGLRAMVVATTRPFETVAPPAWLDLPNAQRLPLDRLDSQALHLLIAGIAPPGRLTPQQIDAIISRSDGVPVFAEELTHATLETIADTTSALLSERVPMVPSTLTESLVARLDRLRHGRETAQLAAVIGSEITLDLLCAISPLSEEAVRAGVAELLAAGIFVRHETTFGEAVAFRQSLLRDAAYALVLRRERIRLHRRIAEVARTQLPLMMTRRLDFIPRHLEEAGEAEEAIQAWCQAGQTAVSRSAASEAIAHFSRALEICLGLPESRSRDETELSIISQLVFPFLAMRGWAAAEVAAMVERALALCATLDARQRILPVLVARWLSGFGTRDRAAEQEIVDQIIATGSDGSEVDRLLVYRVVSSQCLFEGRLHDSLAAFEGFRALYDSSRHDDALAATGATTHAVTIDMGMATCLVLMGRNAEMLEHSQAAIAAARRKGHINTICQTLAAAGGFCAAMVRDAAALDAYGTELLDLTKRYDMPFWRPHGELLLGLAMAARGDAGGLARARQGIDSLVAGRSFALTAWLMFYADAAARAGKQNEVRHALDLAKPFIEAGERWFEAEYHRLRAGLCDGGKAARVCLETAITIARTQGAGELASRAEAELRDLAA